MVPDKSKQVQAETSTNPPRTMSSLGSAVPLVLLLHGRNEGMTEDSTPAILHHLEALHHGQEIVHVETRAVVVILTMVVASRAIMLLPQLVAILHLGHKQLLLTLLLPPVMVATQLQAIPVAILLSNLWVRHLGSLLPLD